MNEAQSLIQELGRLMKRKDVSKDYVARLCEVSWQTINRWLKLENEPYYIYRKILKRAIKELRRME